MNVDRNQRGGAYEVTEHQPIENARQNTGDFFYAGVASAGDRTRDVRPYEAEYNQRNNDLKSSTLKGYTPAGNMNLYNGDINMRQISRDNVLKNDRGVIGTMPYQAPDVMNFGRPAGSTNNLYSNIQMDRNTSDITSMLKSNPYVVDYKSAL
jgi:hypothetical protein